MKKFSPELFSLAVTFMFVIIWVIPLKGITKFVLVQEGVFTMGSYSTTGVVLFSIFSGLISYVMAKSHQCLKSEPSNMNFAEFAFIFTCSMVLTTTFIFLGYPLLGFLVSGGIGSYIIPYLVNLYEQEELKVPLTGDKGTYMNSERPEEDKSISSKPITDEGSSSSGNIFQDQISAIDRIIQEREKLLNDLKNLSGAADNSANKVNVKMDTMLRLASKNQELRMKLLTANKSKLPYSLIKEVEKTFNVDLKNLWDNYNNNNLSLNKNDPNFSKQEFDLHNSYIKKRNAILEDLVQKMQADLKKNNSNYYEELNTHVLKKYRQEVELNQRETKTVQKELALLVNTKNKK